ncbi:MAG: hypothetical protein H6607_08695 [Flavobacteriales bacterium]|nr:hypothetical protein [Flavobacteriales bacterium]
MKQVISFISLLILGQQVLSQSSSSPSLNPKGKWMEIQAGGGLWSNTFTKSFVFENYWDETLINNTKQNAPQRIRGGYSVDASIKIHFSDSIKERPFIIAGYQNIGGLSFHKNAVFSVLQGNAENKSVELKNSGFKQLSFSKIGVGFEKNDDVNNLHYGISMSALALFNYSSFHAKTGILTTSENADSIIGKDINAIFDKTGGGYGIGFDFFVKKQIEKQLFEISIENVGLLLLNKREQSVVTRNFVYEGFDITPSLFSKQSIDVQDSIKNYVETKPKGQTPRGTFIPFTLKMRYTNQLSEFTTIQADLQYISFPGFLPKIGLNYGFKSSIPGTLILVGASGGGFGNYGLTFGLLSKNTRFTITGIEGLASSNLPFYWSVGLESKIGL